MIDEKMMDIESIVTMIVMTPGTNESESIVEMMTVLIRNGGVEKRRSIERTIPAMTTTIANEEEESMIVAVDKRKRNEAAEAATISENTRKTRRIEKRKRKQPSVLTSPR